MSEPNPELVKKAVADRDAHPWRYYKFDHDEMKKFCERLSDQCIEKDRQLAAQAEEIKALLTQGAQWEAQALQAAEEIARLTAVSVARAPETNTENTG